MKILIQRVKEAKVKVERKITGLIGHGLLVFLGIHKEDTPAQTPLLVNKLINLRCFTDEQGKMNLSVQDVEGKVLVVSQFTLYANCNNGRRPDFIDTMRGPDAEKIYEKFIQEVAEELGGIQTGKFGAYMEVSLVNDGPVTLLIDDADKIKRRIQS